ncbi:T9SS type A sorting domain-containing protein [Pontibacter sp. KCTC 32443]|uniref:T9SS type A sorting domain-containing protein n=1 Tax=Pontibacter TaxID=323449 RepID=UPI00164D692F|nr:MULTISPECIES: T9SS type A sorting domain-containing protein [Pontibacter]MBC5774013.1 T9SS type A sorting domain-containing protein [Pontibacter sp. KCTC 32443]
MKSINNYLTKKLCYTATILLLTLIATTNTYAQVNLPPAERCTSKDLELVEAFLSGSDECVACEEGELLDPQSLNLSIDNKTGSTRTSFAFWGTLEVYNSDGELDESVSLTGCNGPIVADTITTLPFSVIETDEPSDYINNSGQIVIECGQTLKLTGLFLAWTDAADNTNRVCPLNPAKIAPKCGTLPEIEVATGLNAEVDEITQISCEGNDGAIDVSVTGGAPPYTYEWTASNGGVIPTGQADDQDLTGLGPGTYSLLVTDDADCTDTLSVTLEAPDPVATPIITVQAATLCEGPSTPTITVCNPIVDAVYTVVQPDEDTITTAAYVSGALVIGGLVAGKDFEIYATLGECNSEIADCDDIATEEECTAAAAASLQKSSSSSIQSLSPSRTTSSIKSIRDADRNTLTAYPVPFRDRVNVEFKAERSGNYTINLYDSKGKLIKELKAGKSKSGQLQSIEVDGRSLPDGMYFIRVVDNAGSRTVKLLKKE